MNTEYGPRNPERDIDRQWESEDIIETKDMNRIENQVRMLTNHTIWDDELGDTIQRDSEPPKKINVKEMSSTAGGITPVPPTTNQDKSILFADGYNQINVTSSIDNINNKQDFTIYRSYGTPGTGNLASFSIGAASTSNIGLMSSTDKSHLDTIWNGELQSNATIVTSNNINSITGLVTTSNFTDQLQSIGVVSTSASGLAPQLDDNAIHFLNGKGQWTVSTVQSVNGKTGVVTLTNTDVGAAPTTHSHNYAENGNALTITRLWKNSSTYFTGEQSLPIQCSNYKAILIVVKFNSSINAFQTWYLPYTTDTNNIRYNLTVSAYASFKYTSRICMLTDNNIYFTHGGQLDTTGDSTVDDTCCVPYLIYGIK